jgi:hypothetical protein
MNSPFHTNFLSAIALMMAGLLALCASHGKIVRSNTWVHVTAFWK